MKKITKSENSKTKEKSIHEGHRERLREAVDNDPELQSFSDFQVLEFVLSLLIPRKDTNPIAHALINEFGSLYNVFHASKEALFAVTGMTRTAAIFISSFYSILRKSEASRIRKGIRLTSVKDVVEALGPNFIGREEERLYCISMDLNDNIKRVTFMGDGLVDTVSVNCNKIFSVATQYSAKKMIIAHNHPSGNVEPSVHDIDLTRTLFVLLANANIILSDHLIFNNDGNYYSFFESGELDDLAVALLGGDPADTLKEVRQRRSVGKYVFDKREDNDDPETYAGAHERLMKLIEDKMLL